MRQAEKERKKIQSRIPFILDPGKKILKKVEKDIKKLKNLFSALFLAKTRLDRPRKREKNFSPEFRSYSTRARKFRKNSKKNNKKLKTKKTSFRPYFQPKRDEIGRERQKKILVQNFVPTRAGLPFRKKMAKKFKKLKNVIPTLFH